MSEVASPFGALVQSLRMTQGLTQDDLAALMGMPTAGGRTVVAFWENGSRVPNAARLRKLAACLGYWPIRGDLSLRTGIVEAALGAALAKGAS